MIEGCRMEFYDLCVQVEDLEEVINFGEKLGFSGIGISHRFEDKKSLDDFIDEVEKKRKDTELDLVISCEIGEENESDMKSKVGKVRQKAEVVIVQGGDFEVNKAAVRDSRVDILAHPEYRRKDSGMDHKTTRMASTNDVAIGFVLHPLTKTYGKVRSHILDHMKRNLELCEKYNARPVVMSGARNVYGMKDPRELAALPDVLGSGKNESMEMVSENPIEIVSVNRNKLSGKEKKEGVEEIY